MTNDRPLTIKEIQAKKKALREADNKKIRIRNKTRLQNIPLQIFGKNSKKAVHQITIQIGPGKHVDLPEYRLISEQVATLKKRGMIATSRIGPHGKNIKETDYRQFLSSIEVEQPANPSSSGKNKSSSSNKKTKKDSKKESGLKSQNVGKITKSDG